MQKAKAFALIALGFAFAHIAFAFAKSAVAYALRGRKRTPDDMAWSAAVGEYQGRAGTSMADRGQVWSTRVD